MAIAFANLGVSANPDIISTANETSYANTSWTPPSDGLICCFVSSTGSDGVTNPTMSGNSLTWVRIGTIFGGGVELSLFGADATGATTGATTVSFGADGQSSCHAHFFQVTGADEDNGVAQAFVQSPTSSGTGTSGSVTLAAAADSNNRPISGWHHLANQVHTPQASWTELDDGGVATPAQAAESQFRDDAFETTASASWATSSAWLGMAAEIKIASTGNATATPSTVAAVASIPGPTVLAAATVAVAVVAALAAIPAPTIQAAAVATPSAVAAIASVPAPSVAGTAVVAPSTVAAVAAVPAPSVLAGAIVSPATVAAVASVPASTVLADAIVAPSTVAAVGDVPAPTIIATGLDAMTAPATVAAIAAVPAPTVAAAAAPTPATVAAVVTVPAPAVSGTATAAPATLAATAAVPAPSVQADARVSTATVAAVAAIPAPAVQAAAITSPNSVAALAAVPAPTVLVAEPNATATPATVAVVASVPTPSILATHDTGTTATPAGSPYAGWQPWWEPIPPLAGRRR